VSEDAETESRTVTEFALAVKAANYWAASIICTLSVRWPRATDVAVLAVSLKRECCDSELK
jgi:hypothetical protein